MREKIKILFVYLLPSSFVKADLEILQRHFDVIHHQWTRTRDIKNVLRVVWHIFRTDLSFIWFADIHATRVVFLSKLFRKKTIVVVGGYEVANVPEINYGLVRNPKSARRVKYVLENADKVLAVDDSLRKDAIINAMIKGENIITVPTGYDTVKWKFNGEKEDLVLTVSSGNYWDRVRLKGLDVFIESAKLLPDIKFTLIGIQGDALRRLQSVAPLNVDFIKPIPHEMLIPYFQKAKVYCQLSMREGLPNALCEAMLCECVPVGTDVQGVRTAIGDTGFYVPYGNPKQTAQKIEKALMSDKGKAARERIKTLFPIEKREERLVKIINELLKKTL